MGTKTMSRRLSGYSFVGYRPGKEVSPDRSPCFRGRRRSLLLAAFVCVSPSVLGGCNGWPWREGPVPDSVATCRELSQQAIANMEANRWQDAEGLLNRAVAACPIDPDARRYYAETLSQRGASAEALAQLEEAIRLTPDDTLLVIRAGEICYQMEDYAAARRWAVEAINLDPSAADAWALSGYIYLAEENPRRALADFQRALGYRPEDPELLAAVAEVYLGLGRPGRALLHLQNLSETYLLGEVPPVVIARKADALTALGRYQEAAVHYRSICQEIDPSADGYYRLAQAELRAGEIQEARIATEMALQVDPQHPLSIKLLSQLPPGSGGEIDAAQQDKTILPRQ